MKFIYDERNNPLRGVNVEIPEPVLTRAFHRIKVQCGLETEMQVNVKRIVNNDHNNVLKI